MVLAHVFLCAAALFGGPAQTPAIKFPVLLPDDGAYLNAAWDVGQAIIAGQPTEATLRKLKDQGFRLIVSFRTKAEMANRKEVPFDEEALVKSLGMTYINLPMSGASGESPDSPAVVLELAKAMQGNEGKALLHCTVGWRASHVWTAYLAQVVKMDLSEAVRHGQAMLVNRMLERLLGTNIRYALEASKQQTEPKKTAKEPSQWSRIVTPSSAVALLSKGGLILDVRSNYMEYIDGHLRGAVHMDANSLRGPKAGLPVQYRTEAEMRETLRLAGASSTTPIAVYANPNDVLNATMTMYVLEKLGYKNTRIIDGGSVAAAQDNLVEKPIPMRDPGAKANDRTLPIAATLDDIKRVLKTGGVTLVDARPPAQYTGEQNLWVRNGHMPGAINVFWRTLMEEDNAHSFRSKAEIQKIFDAKGIRPDQDVIVYCGTSKEATLIWTVLYHELGFKKVRVYEGAWTEYATRTDLPVVKGS